MVTTPQKKAWSKNQPANLSNPRPLVEERIAARGGRRLKIEWEKLPEDYQLPDDPVDNITQPALAAALTESLARAGYLSEDTPTTTNYGICAKVNGKTVVKAPDWSWIPAISVPLNEIERSYTPTLEGDIPLIVMEFLSETPGTEYSVKSTYPPGKLFFYENILRVPNYAIFEPQSGRLEVRHFDENGIYDEFPPDEMGHFWIEEAQLFLGVWAGSHNGRTGNWLRWWTSDKQMLLWGEEISADDQLQLEQEKQRAEQEKQRAEQEKQRADDIQRKAIAQLKKAGLPPAQIAAALDLSIEAVERLEA